MNAVKNHIISQQITIFILKKNDMNKRKQTTMIILHCSATREGQDYSVDTIRKWHVARGFSTIGYHFVIHLDGKIEAGRQIGIIGAHCKGHNANSIGIVYVGGLDNNMKPKDTRTIEQKQSLYKLIFELLDKYNLTVNDVYTHNYFNKLKECPCFSTEQIRNELNELTAT